MKPNVSSIEQVISENMCVGCGACAFANPENFSIKFNDDGYNSANILEFTEVDSEMSKICPISGAGLSEDQISESLWPEATSNREIGRHAATIACYATEERLRMAGGSGGLITWTCAELLSRGEIDAVVHVQSRDHEGEALFEYAISETEEQIRAGSKSRYYSISLADVLHTMATSGKRYAVVGVPCFAKAVRLLVAEGKLPETSVAFVVGLVCGHMKSRYFADYLAWQKDVLPGELTGFDFRHKLMERPASDYGFRLQTSQRNEVYPMASVKGRDWGEGLFKLPGCEYCDDVLAECADIAIGDAWLPDYVSDARGTNVAVVRHPKLVEMIREGAESGSLWVADISPADVAKSQASGLRHRREGLSHRLARRANAGRWTPVKRVPAVLAPNKRRRDIYDLRLAITERSNSSFARSVAAGSMEIFDREIGPLIKKLRGKTYGTLARRIARKLLAVLPRR